MRSLLNIIHCHRVDLLNIRLARTTADSPCRAMQPRARRRGGEGVALEGTKKGGAHSLKGKNLLKTSIRPYDNNLFLKKIFLQNVLLLECRC